MIRLKKFIILFFVFTLSVCGFGEVCKIMRNEKINTTDEFLVKKKDPLKLPPEYSDLPTPGSLKEEKKNEGQKIKKILKIENEKSSNNSSSKNIEKSILDKIKK